MIATGQLIMNRSMADWGDMSPQDVARLEDAGVVSLSRVCGMIEFPLFIKGLPPSQMYAFSVETSHITSLSRFRVRMEPESESGQMERLVSMPESASAISLRLSPSGHQASRAGWGSFKIEGIVSQPDDPFLFAGIFYEISLDQEGETMIIAPNSGARHYAAGDLAEIGVPAVAELPIWGYAEVPFALAGDAERG